MDINRIFFSNYPKKQNKNQDLSILTYFHSYNYFLFPWNPVTTTIYQTIINYTWFYKALFFSSSCFASHLPLFYSIFSFPLIYFPLIWFFSYFVFPYFVFPLFVFPLIWVFPYSVFPLFGFPLIWFSPNLVGVLLLGSNCVWLSAWMPKWWSDTLNSRDADASKK